MERRELLVGGLAVGAVGLSGCADLLSSGRNTNHAAESVKTASNGSTPTRQESADRVARTDVARNYYQEGHEPYTEAEDLYRDARNRNDGAEYLEAIQQFERTAGLYKAATGMFLEAVFMAREGGYSEAEQIASRAVSYCTQRRLACQQYASAAMAYERGDDDRGENVKEDATVHLDNAAQHEVANVDEFASALEADSSDG